ncbi:amidase [Xylophilus sp. GOD-11R]|uniref:amidase n=1 Tax=Xylophilus sp. GOD-11R TaxID=3089814 RepID=UPI00298BCD57|nr:amidase [Xylophilus sp. GOD-11R]WPB55622.1 amidase [Xylophilus sp. GOD-11R]
MTARQPLPGHAPAATPAAPAHCFIPYPAPPGGNPHASAGPLSGLTFAMKDIYDVAGYPTGCGNPHLLALSGIKTRSSPVFDQLLAAGAAFAGKVVTDELAFSLNGHNVHFGRPRNGAVPDRITGGSSSGSASAVSCGLVDIAIGSDTGGSVRGPASHCGLVGLRPTHDRVSLDRCMALAPRFDTCGWFARDIATFARAGDVLLGEDSAPIARPRWLVPADVLDLLPPQVRATFDSALARLAPVIGEPAPVQANCGIGFDTLYWAFRHLQGFEAWQNQGETIERYGLMLGPGVKERFAWSRDVASHDVEPHEVVQHDFRDLFSALLGQDGVMLLPTMPDVAPLLSESEESLDDYRNRAIRMLCLSGLSGTPQISLPLMSLNDVPLGLSLIGPAGSDRSLISIAATLLAAQP